jgi:hypothetical protein
VHCTVLVLDVWTLEPNQRITIIHNDHHMTGTKLQTEMEPKVLKLSMPCIQCVFIDFILPVLVLVVLVPVLVQVQELVIGSYYYKCSNPLKLKH